MNNEQLFDHISGLTSKMVTQKYSTSFSWASKLFKPEIRQHIYNIYGFVRFADEIVDTFHQYDKAKLMMLFENEYRASIENGISLNPIINSFCKTQREKNIPQHLVDSFLHSMKMDLGEIQNLNDQKYNEYIYGSAEVVGLMCLKVFLNGNVLEYEQLKPYAQSLGAAFQKINFLRDISADFNDLGRTYFPQVNFKCFSTYEKINIENDIENDFQNALIGIKRLPISSKIAVYMAYKYYLSLFKKIKQCKPEVLITQRIRVSNIRKVYLFGEMMVFKNLNLIK
ncbi:MULTISPECIES: phytoene/squalene synthase family protein [Flavobacterium]|uniref:Phytoene/squalene synthase family protein n=2 Tax=Flavobacterium TaxID=237 RepID=A0AA94EZR4_9FLAO|nr:MULTISPECIES: phytoene/squalene synthase family protein [Flavobacterium]OXA83996.1 phytoene synthase [Flavobacterium columnare] [Flavobacterium columnare NBRC 100251 = ATCC 23463]AMA48455.1 phytoene synthase [Flavobacterium covae]AND65416.1 phytoene synthase [Flavobacterium covae]MCH4830384.1 phytoene/squalene synthase family protein [Flavobacterium columnare]MCH4833679.1 phytoene/squalene synthase family protein [Flavobacterium columnare]